MQRILTFLTLALAPFCATSAAELKLAAVFSDHMVLQRDKPVPVWGWADPEEKISVEFADQKQTTTADAAGNWSVKLAPLLANANSRTLVVRSEQQDRKVERIDVLVGEVWLGSGQSNMAMTVIAPLIPFAIRGVLWYQGESNSQPGKDQRYQHQLPLLVTDWRSRWGEELPFAWVQLPNYERGSEGWPVIREAMLKSLRLPRTGMAITIDIGEAEDIHPKNKQDVGHRLAFWALGEVYGKQVAATSGPLPLGHEKIGSEIVVRFKHTQGGLKSKEGELQGFVIAGEDQQWKPAKARIEGDKIFISHGDLTKPVAVRYAWARNPICNLINGAGLPASPFRTDDWSVPNELTRK